MFTEGISKYISVPKNLPAVCWKNTLDNCEWARENAQRRRYDAVLDTVPRTNYIVSIN